MQGVTCIGVRVAGDEAGVDWSRAVRYVAHRLVWRALQFGRVPTLHSPPTTTAAVSHGGLPFHPWQPVPRLLQANIASWLGHGYAFATVAELEIKPWRTHTHTLILS